MSGSLIFLAFSVISYLMNTTYEDHRLVAILEACRKSKNLDEQIWKLCDEFYGEKANRHFNDFGIMAEITSKHSFKDSTARVDTADPKKVENKTVRGIGDFEKKMAKSLEDFFCLPRFLIVKIRWAGYTFVTHEVTISLAINEALSAFNGVRGPVKMKTKKEAATDSVKALASLPADAGQRKVPRRLTAGVVKEIP